MSRATSSAVTTTAPKQLYLAVRRTPSGPILYASETAIPGSVCISGFDFPAMNFMFALMREKLFLPRLNKDIFETVLSFLYDGIAAPLVEPANETLKGYDRLDRLVTMAHPNNVFIPRAYYPQQKPIENDSKKSTLSYDPHTWDTFKRGFFDVSVTHRINSSLFPLATACLNAVEDLDVIKNIINKTSPEQCAILLSTKGTANVTHLETLNPSHSFRRTGTALQMAIYSDDEGVQALLKEYMDPAEYERQAIEAFECVLPLEVKNRLVEERATAATYQQAADAQQKADAKNLCAELFAAMLAAHPSEFTCAVPNYIASTTSPAVIAAVAKFKNDLLLYTQKNPIHNRYILERLYLINASLEEKSYCLGRDCFLSQQGITEAQLLMSKRWVQHYARGPYYIAENKNELAVRTSICRNTNPPVDIHSVMSRLRLESRCLDIRGGAQARASGGVSGGGVRDALQILCRAKTACSWSLSQSECEQVPESPSVGV